MDLFNRLRKKSDEAKTRFAFFVAVSITFAIAFIWSTTLPARFSSVTNDRQGDGEMLEQQASLTEVFQDVKDKVNAVSDLDEQFDNIDTDTETLNLDALNTMATRSIETLDDANGTNTPNDFEKIDSEGETKPEIVLIEIRKSDISKEDTGVE